MRRRRTKRRAERALEDLADTDGPEDPDVDPVLADLRDAYAAALIEATAEGRDLPEWPEWLRENAPDDVDSEAVRKRGLEQQRADARDRGGRGGLDEAVRRRAEREDGDVVDVSPSDP